MWCSKTTKPTNIWTNTVNYKMNQMKSDLRIKLTSSSFYCVVFDFCCCSNLAGASVWRGGPIPHWLSQAVQYEQ